MPETDTTRRQAGKKVGERRRIRIGTEMPAWLSPRLHAPARIVIGTILGVAVGTYCVALALTFDRILRGLATQDSALNLVFDIGHLAVLVLGAFVLRHGLTRPKPAEEAEF